MVAVLDKNCRRLVAQGCFSGGGGGGGADALVTGRGGVSWRRRGVVVALLVKRDVNNGFGIMAISTAAAASFPTPSMALCLYLSDYAALSLSLSYPAVTYQNSYAGDFRLLVIGSDWIDARLLSK